MHPNPMSARPSTSQCGTLNVRSCLHSQEMDLISNGRRVGSQLSVIRSVVPAFRCPKFFFEKETVKIKKKSFKNGFPPFFYGGMSMTVNNGQGWPLALGCSRGSASAGGQRRGRRDGDPPLLAR
jgi:hypothetical protein